MKFLKTRDVKSPNRGTSHSAGIDLFVPNDWNGGHPMVMDHGDSVLIPSGIKFNVPRGKVLIAENKSGVATKKGLILGACVIDEDYLGEVHIHLIKATKGPIEVSPGDKIIQLVLSTVEYCDLDEVKSLEELSEGKYTERGEGAFGSTGTK